MENIIEIDDLLASISEQEVRQTSEAVEATKKLYNDGNSDSAINTVVLRMKHHGAEQENF